MVPRQDNGQIQEGLYLDNSEAERNIRPMTIERSNSKSFGSHEGVEISAVYHTIIATCKAQAVSVCEYLKQFFTACVNGRTDYERSTLRRMSLVPVGSQESDPYAAMPTS